MTIDRAATAWTPHPGGPLRYRANSRFGADGLPPGAWFGRVSAVVEAPDGSVVVFQRGPAIEPIVVLDREGQYSRSWDQGFGLPHGMRLMPDGNLWLTDAGRHRVLKTTLDGEVLLELGTADEAGTDERTFNKPTDVAVAPDGTIYVSDGYGNCRVVVFDPDGTYRGTWGRPGTAPGEFDTPHSVAVAPDGSIWVSDRGNLRIQRFEPDGRYIDAWTHLGATQCFDFYEDELWLISHRTIGELLGWDSLGGRLMRVDPVTGEVLGSITLAGHFFHRAPSGDIWVGGLNGTVIRLTTDWIDLPGEDEPAR
jgi:DNA-binding beta-propeller fold protein YncE